jgi:TorA maturation chaperone TorD
MSHEQAVDAMRADFYRLLAALLLAPPSAELLQHLGTTTTEPEADDALNVAWCELVAASATASTDIEGVVAEYDALFIGVGRGEVVPYASWYITGMLMDKPLRLCGPEIGLCASSGQLDDEVL